MSNYNKLKNESKKDYLTRLSKVSNRAKVLLKNLKTFTKSIDVSDITNLSTK